MVRTTTCLLVLLVLAGRQPLATGQAPGRDATPPAEPAPRPRLLGPPEADPGAPPPPYPWPAHGHPADLPGRYFVSEPVVDDPHHPQPGFFADVEVGAVIPYIKDSLFDTVQLGPVNPPAPSLGKIPPSSFQVPHVGLGLTASPHVEFGYRLPEAFGEFLVGYRFLGSESSAGSVGVGAPHGRLLVHIIDVEYGTRQIDLPWHWDMRWKAGVRMAQNQFDNQVDVTGLPGTSGVTLLQDHNRFIGIGPTAALELTSPCHEELPGLRLYGRVEAATLLGRIAQNLAEMTNSAGGVPLAGFTPEEGSQAVPILGGELGLSYQPPGWDATILSLGYGFEHWWSIGKVKMSAAEMGAQGIYFRTQVNF
jgi:hypothetical protein